MYGFAVSGSLLGDAVPGGALPEWPALHVVVAGSVGTVRRETSGVTGDRAVVPMADGERWLVADRAASSATFHGPPIEPAELAHPYLSPAAAIFSRWHGREVFHGGTFLTANGQAIAVLGRRDAGKSTLLAALAARGVPVLADDLIVVEQGQVFAGPRTIDLRAEPGPALTGNGVLPVERARSGSRWRVRLPGGRPTAPLGGWIFLAPPGPGAAADSVGGAAAAPTVEPVLPPLGLSRIARSRGYPELESDPKVVLDLAALPAWELRVPRTWTALEAAVDVVLDRAQQ